MLAYFIASLAQYPTVRLPLATGWGASGREMSCSRLPAPPARAMVQPSPAAWSVLRNRLLLALSVQDFGLLEPQLERVPLPIGTRLVEPNAPIEHVYFLEQGIASVVAATPLPPIKFPRSPDWWRDDEALQAEAQAPQAPREQGHQAAGNVSALRPRGLFSGGVGFATPPHMPFATAH